MKRSRLVVVMLVTLMLAMGALVAGPATALATDGSDLTTGASNLQTQTVTKYGIWIGKKQVTSKNAKDVLGNGTVKYDAKTNTLTLKNAKINKAYIEKNGSFTYRYGLFTVEDTLKIKLVGNNKISVPGTANAGSYALNSRGDFLTICGNGSLTLNGGKADYYSHGIYCDFLTIQDKAKVTANGGKAGYFSYGVECGKVFTIKGSAKLVATGKTYAMSMAPKYSKYTPLVKYGENSKSTKTKKKPPKRVYTSNKYVSIKKTS